ncbi:MAG TPA: M48 family metallopeptidase [Pseudomonadales bacterium]|nr:M48 family metallopeptidase [Pseudomonadales bacterium]
MPTLRLTGNYFDGVQARAQHVALSVDPHGVVTVSPSTSPSPSTETLTCHVREISISPRLGNTPRHLRFANGALFETGQNDIVDALLEQFPAASDAPDHDRVQAWVHTLERNAWAVCASVAGLVLMVLWFAVYGAPLLARVIAFRLPAEVTTYISRDGLQWLDKSFLQPSTLDAARQQALQDVFAGLLPEDREGLEYRLVFRSSKRIGPNAFALPDATILMTDELVNLAENDGQIAVVLLHEIGHVKNRHMLRQVIQQSGLAALLVTITGDIHGASSMVLALPGVLMQAQYSQAMESEADTYALEHLQQHGLSPSLFAQIMRRLEAWHAHPAADRQPPSTQPDDARQDEGEQASVWQYLSTHPATAERIRRFEQAQEAAPH